MVFYQYFGWELFVVCVRILNNMDVAGPKENTLPCQYETKTKFYKFF